MGIMEAGCARGSAGGFKQDLDLNAGCQWEGPWGRQVPSAKSMEAFCLVEEARL